MKAEFDKKVLKQKERDEGVEREMKDFWDTLDKDIQVQVNEQAKAISVKKYGYYGMHDMSIKTCKLDLLMKMKYKKIDGGGVK